MLNERNIEYPNGGTKALLVGAGLFAVAAPIAFGLLDGVTLRAQTVSPTLTFEVASVRLAPPPGWKNSSASIVRGPWVQQQRPWALLGSTQPVEPRSHRVRHSDLPAV